MLWWNYYLCIVTDPGRVPPQWVHTNISSGLRPLREIALTQSLVYIRNLMCRTTKVLKSTGWGIPGTAGNASGTSHREHITVRTARRESLIYLIHVTV